MKCARTKRSDVTAGNGGSHGKKRAAEDLCQTCALCCNGAIFADVRLQSGDSPKRLYELGLSLYVCRRDGTTPYEPSAPAAAPLRQHKFSQPCAALEGCRCRIYAERPGYCRDFECGVLKRFQTGAMPRRGALRLIRSAQRSAEKARRLLRELGDSDEGLRLADRFRRTARRLEAIRLSPVMASAYGQLTLAVHDLNFLLSEAFYPGRNVEACLSREGQRHL